MTKAERHTQALIHQRKGGAPEASDRALDRRNMPDPLDPTARHADVTANRRTTSRLSAQTTGIQRLSL